MWFIHGLLCGHWWLCLVGFCFCSCVFFFFLILILAFLRLCLFPPSVVAIQYWSEIIFKHIKPVWLPLTISGSVCEFRIYSPSLDSFQVCTSCVSLARVHRLLIKQDAWIVSSFSSMHTHSSQPGYLRRLSSASVTLSFYLPITFVCPVALLHLSLPNQHCNHRSVEPLAFPICLDLTLQHHEAWIISPSLNQVSPSAVKLLVIHNLPRGGKITTLNDGREKGSSP